MWALALVWGASYYFIKVALRDFEPTFLVFARLAMAAAVLVPIAYRARAFAGPRAHVKDILVLAPIQVVVPFLLITYGEEHVSSSLTGILIASSPIFTALLLLRSPTERLGGWNLGGVLIGLVGVALLFGVDLTGDSDTLIGGLMIVGAALGYAVGALYLKRRMGHLPSIGLAATSMSVSTVMLLPVAAFTVPAAAPSLGPTAALVALGVLGTGLAFGIFYTLIATVGAAKASVVAYLAPGFSLAYGALLLDEPVTVGAVGGLVAILAGSYMAAQGVPPWRRRTAPVPAPA